MDKLRTIIVDDVKLIRLELNSMLANFHEIEVVGEANNGENAKLLIRELKPDVVFLDIRLPKLTGFELLECIDIDFQIVFISSFDKYLPEARKYNATDFLMKPVKLENLKLAVQKLILNYKKSQNYQGIGEIVNLKKVQT
jgi:two-component system LytT family response regulator